MEFGHGCQIDGLKDNIPNVRPSLAGNKGPKGMSVNERAKEGVCTARREYHKVVLSIPVLNIRLAYLVEKINLSQ